MSLPSQDEKDLYTKDELEHIVARRVMKHRLDDLESRQKQQTEEVTKILGKLEQSITEIHAVINQSAEVASRCRDEIRYEISREYVKHDDLQRESDRLADGMRSLFFRGSIALALAIIGSHAFVVLAL